MTLICTITYRAGRADQQDHRKAVVAALCVHVSEWLSAQTRQAINMRSAVLEEGSGHAQDIELGLAADFTPDWNEHRELIRLDVAALVRTMWQRIHALGHEFPRAGWQSLLVRVWPREEVGAFVLVEPGLVSSCWGTIGLDPRTYLTPP